MKIKALFYLALIGAVLIAGCSKDEESTNPAEPQPPNAPATPVPADGAIGQSIQMGMSWTCSDPDGGTLIYDVYFGTVTPPPLVAAGHTLTSYSPGGLTANTTYYWKIVARDADNLSTAGPIWRFTTVTSSTAGMVLVPAGSFNMGADYSVYSLPIHTVNLPAFYIDIYEVTNAKYKAFCDATGRAYPADPGFSGMPNYFTDPAFADYPVVNVSWNEANTYAAWAGKRLPTEAEWERAAKGNLDNRQWPWGDTWNGANANVSDNPDDGYPYSTSPVGSYLGGVSPAGCYDMAGNVYEWCADDWHADYTNAPTDGSAWIDNPRGTSVVFRGGNWGLGSGWARCAMRGYAYPTSRGSTQGFRCAMTP